MFKIHYNQDVVMTNPFTGEVHEFNQAYSQEVGSEQEAIDWASANNIASYTLEEFTPVPITNYPLRIMSIIQEEFKHWHPSKIDFRKHLHQDLHINKDVDMVAGRPSAAHYTLDGENIARIRFTFDFDSIGFVERRKELLGYFNTNDEIEEEYTISDETYTMSSTYHLIKKIEESVKTRENVMQDLKTIINGFLIQVLMPQGQTLSQVQYEASRLFYKYNASINVWVETGSGSLNSDIGSDAEFTWLDLELAPSLSIRTYIQSKID